jgi:hypothetical protein
VSAVLLEDVRRFIRRHVVLDDAQSVALTLWVAHTHVFDAFARTPYLAISSAEKRSGKSLLLEVLGLLIRDPLPTANISDAALFRVIEERKPTLLIDEIDAVFGKKAREREEFRGILNAGYRRGATTHRMGGKNNTALQTFSVYCPKAFAGIGDCLPDTIADRAIPIRLKRRTRDEPGERFRLRVVEPEGLNLRDRLAVWLEPNQDYLPGVWPDLPDELDDRAQDVWEGLLAVAEIGGWSERAWAAAIALSTGEEREDDSVTARLIRDVSVVFLANDDEPMKTSDLLEGLYRIEESPWGDWFGRPLSAHGFSKLLKTYRIKTMSVYTDGHTVRGYRIEQFSDAFAQLGVRSVRSVRGEARSEAGSNASDASNASVAEHVSGDDPVQDELDHYREVLAWPTRPVIGDEEFLQLLYEALQAETITEAEFHAADRAHRFVASQERDR